MDLKLKSKMNRLVLMIMPALICVSFFTGCGGGSYVGFVPADSLIVNIDKYVNKKVRTEGYVAHVCGVDGMKMKLRSDGGEVIVVVPHDNKSFDYSLSKNRVAVYGSVKENRIDKSYIDEREKGTGLLCHVDQKLCKDTDWVNSKIEAGVADSLLKKDIAFLREKLKQQGKGYISIVTIVCDNFETITK